MGGEHKIVYSFAAVMAICAATALSIDRPGAGVSRAEPRLKNLANAARIEVHDRATRRVLSGSFLRQPTATASEAARAELLAPSGDAVGRAEIELVRHPGGVLVQELEVDVAGLHTNAVFDVSIDGQWIGSFSTDPRGAAELEQFGRVAEKPASGD